jgi:hypothetical protein
VRYPRTRLGAARTIKGREDGRQFRAVADQPQLGVAAFSDGNEHLDDAVGSLDGTKVRDVHEPGRGGRHGISEVDAEQKVRGVGKVQEVSAGQTETLTGKVGVRVGNRRELVRASQRVDRGFVGGMRDVGAVQRSHYQRGRRLHSTFEAIKDAGERPRVVVVDHVDAVVTYQAFQAALELRRPPGVPRRVERRPPGPRRHR